MATVTNTGLTRPCECQDLPDLTRALTYIDQMDSIIRLRGREGARVMWSCQRALTAHHVVCEVEREQERCGHGSVRSRLTGSGTSTSWICAIMLGPDVEHTKPPDGRHCRAELQTAATTDDSSVAIGTLRDRKRTRCVGGGCEGTSANEQTTVVDESRALVSERQEVATS